LPAGASPRSATSSSTTGPDVDYLCTGQYTLAFMQPLIVGATFAGVVGVDVLVAWFEARLLDVMESVERSCLLVNAAGRVVTSSDPAWRPETSSAACPSTHGAGDENASPQWRATAFDRLRSVVLTDADRGRDVKRGATRSGVRVAPLHPLHRATTGRRYSCERETSQRPVVVTRKPLKTPCAPWPNDRSDGDRETL
jgi:C4-dicarboxylate-specific signal transduction histidine kinase